MTKTLTEQWREGTLKSGTYYIKVKYGNNLIYTFDYYNDRNNEWSFVRDVREVLDIVPSYNEYLVLSGFKKIEEDVIDNLVKIHTEKLEKKLEIATKALKRIDPPNIIFDDYRNSGIDLWEIAHNALKEMEGVK